MPAFRTYGSNGSAIDRAALTNHSLRDKRFVGDKRAAAITYAGTGSDSSAGEADATCGKSSSKLRPIAAVICAKSNSGILMNPYRNGAPQ